MSVSKYPKLVGYSKVNDRIRESQRNIRSNRPVAGRGIIVRETSGGTVISVDDSIATTGKSSTPTIPRWG